MRTSLPIPIFGESMKYITAIILALVLIFPSVMSVNAQSAESIWIEANVTEYKTGDTVLVTVYAASVTPVQGFTFQIRYDPACLQPANASSPVAGMNGLSLPQTPGLVDATFASTAPQMTNGIIAEVQFTALAGCQTNLVLESAGLAIRNAEGFAAPLPGVTIGNSNVTLTIDQSAGNAQAPVVLGTPLALGSEAETGSGGLSGFSVVLLVLLGIVVGGGIVFVVIKVL